MLRALALCFFATGALSIAATQAGGEISSPAVEPGVVPEGARDAERLPRAAEGPLYVASVEGEIDLGLAAYLRRTLASARDDGAGAVVLQINTPGGRVDAALEIKDLLLDAPLPTLALVNRQAFSAGALIALAAEQIYMVPGSSMGAAAPVMGTGEMAGEKMVSALRTAFAATAERRGRDPILAKAMVDESVEIEGIIAEGRLLTLTADRAIALGMADGAVDSLDSLVGALAPPTTSVVQSEPSLAERLVRFLTNPVVASLLMSLGFLGLFFELQSPGWGIGGSVAIVCLGLYFWGHHLAGLAGWESAILVGIGIALMAAEVFILPGFGVLGLLGLASFVTGLFLSRMSSWGLPGEATRAFYVVGVSLLMMLAGAWAMLTYLPKNRFFAGLVLFSSATGEPHDAQAVGPPWGKEERASYLGRQGVAATDLRPSGTIRVDGAPLDVVTEGTYVPEGTLVEVIEDTGTRRVVRPIDNSDNEG